MTSLKTLLALLVVVGTVGIVYAAEGDKAAPENPKAEGKITGITLSEDKASVTAVKLTVGEGEAAKVHDISVGADTKVTVNGAEAKATDLKEGDSASVEYTESGEADAKKMAAVKIDAKREEPKTNGEGK